jgi:hypothetical protein
VKCNRPSAHCQRCSVHGNRAVGHCHELQKMFGVPEKCNQPSAHCQGPCVRCQRAVGHGNGLPKKCFEALEKCNRPSRTAQGAPYTATWLLDIASGFKTNVLAPEKVAKRCVLAAAEGSIGALVHSRPAANSPPGRIQALPPAQGSWEVAREFGARGFPEPLHFSAPHFLPAMSPNGPNQASIFLPIVNLASWPW